MPSPYPPFVASFTKRFSLLARGEGGHEVLEVWWCSRKYDPSTERLCLSGLDLSMSVIVNGRFDARNIVFKRADIMTE